MKCSDFLGDDRMICFYICYQDLPILFGRFPAILDHDQSNVMVKLIFS